MAAVRAELLDGAGNISVTDVAARAGFNHFGRFAQQYRRASGEAPSVTLRRNRLTDRACPELDGEHIAASDGYTTVRPGIWRDRPLVTVLPCEVSSTSRECPYFAEALAEGLATALCRSHSLSVVKPHSLKRANQLDDKGFVRDLRAHYVLAGRVAQIGERVRVIIRLIDAKAGCQIWGDAFDGTIGDLFGLQDRITKNVRPLIPVQIRCSEIEQARRKPLQDLDARGMTTRAMPLVSARSVSEKSLGKRRSA